MTSPESPVLARKSSLRSLIAWLSVCLLTAGWGAKLDSSVREQWARVGSFGLAAAVGLEVAARTRRLLKMRAQQNATNRRITRNVDDVAAQSASLAQLGEMLQHICQDSGTDLAPSGEVGEEPRLRFRLPVQLRPLIGDETASPPRGPHSFVAHVRNISATGVGLIHNEHIDSPRYVLDFPLKSGDSLSVLVELIWQHRLADGPYHSGGKLIEAVRTGDGQTESIGVAGDDARGTDLTRRPATVAT
jgi:hypothetical protein